MLPDQTHLFSLPEGLHYLNCAYMSPLLRAAEEAGIAGIRRKRDPTGVESRHFFEEADAARERFARLVGAAEPGRVALVPAASYGLAIAARGVECAPGRNVVVAGEQFPSNVHVWRRLCREHDMQLRMVAPPDGMEERGRRWNERLLEAIDPETAAVALAHVHWTDGTRFDLERLGERAREVGAALIVDGTQSVGALRFDLQRIRPDALVCAGYKWLMGPYGMGCAWFGPRYDRVAPLEETWIGRLGSENFRGLVDYTDAYQPGAARFDVGERSNFVLLPMLLAGLDQLLAWGVERIQQHCEELTGTLVEELCGHGFAVEEGAWRAAHLFGVRLPAGWDGEAVQRRLAERRVVVSLRGSAVRISPHVYNGERDIAALREALLAPG